jgi:hypothetical protein
MAILKKRTSKRQLPEARGIERAPISSVIKNSSNSAPTLGSPTSQSITSSGSGTKAPSLTSTTTTSPAVTNKTSTTPTSITTSPSTYTKPTVAKNTASSSTTNKVMNALTGAALGVGAGALIDKITGKPVANANATVTPNMSGAVKSITDSAVAKAKALIGNNPTSVIKNPTTGLPTGTGYGDDKTEYTTDSLGNTYKTMPDGTSVLYRAKEVPEDTSVYPPNKVAVEDSLSPNETLVKDETPTRGLGSATTDTSSDGTPQYFQDDQGNYYTMNADGGYDFVAFSDGTIPIDYSNQDTNLAENTWTDPDTGAVWTLSSDGEWNTDFNYDDYFANNNTSLADNTDNADNTDYTVKGGGLITMMKNGGDVQGYASGGVTQTFDDGSYTNTYDDGTVDFFDSEGRFYGSKSGNNVATEQNVLNPKKVTLAPNYGPATYDSTTGVTSNKPLGSSWPAGYVSNGDGTATQVFDDGSTITVDENLNPINSTNATDITSSGGGGRNWYDNLGSKLSTGIKDLTGISDATLGKITGALPAAGAGALVASLLGSASGGGSTNQGLDMSKVGVINPRTTDFGIGPTRFVGYDQYGTDQGNYTPNAELLTNLNAPAYNPVNEGDYGYEPAQEDVPAMASGGLSSMQTPVASYYTFGQPADILANLGMRQQPPQNPPEMMSSTDQQPKYPTSPQQLDGKQSPLAMAQKTPQDSAMQPQNPQPTPPQMRSGGLPHVSNVPVVEGRMDFRNGSAVHGDGDGQSDDIPAMLADGEYVIDAETVAQIGNGSTKAGAQALDKFRESIRAHKRSAPINKIPPKTKALTSYLKGAK